MAKNTTGNVNKNTLLRNTIKEMIHSIEAVMSDIHSVVGDIGGLMEEIDTVADKLEQWGKRKRQLRKPEIILDANRNQCEVNRINEGKPGQIESQVSPYLDHMYANMETDCQVCEENIHTFTYNERYPLWMQYDTWRTGNTGTMSTMSEVSAGSDVSAIFDKPWKRVSNSEEYVENNEFHDDKSKHVDNGHSNIAGIGKCCDHKRQTDDQYCGIYEDMMEEQLEGMCSDWNGSDVDDFFSDDEDIYDEAADYFTDDEGNSFSDDVADMNSVHTLSLSDENVIHYTKPWTPCGELEYIKHAEFRMLRSSTCIELIDF